MHVHEYDCVAAPQRDDDTQGGWLGSPAVADTDQMPSVWTLADFTDILPPATQRQ